MKLLILGGTIFLGRHLVEAALASGHEVTLFNRGKRNPDLFPEVERLRGNRDGDLGALHDRRWDAVIDTSGYIPRHVRATAELLADAVGHYTFVSTISVYRDETAADLDETHPVGTLEDTSTEEITGETYGPLKALCENAAEKAMPGRVLHVRPGLIVGPHDPTDRFTYWPHRIAQGGRVLGPGRPEREVQFIDVRDLAEWTLRMVETGRTGVYNATGPEQPLTMLALLEACKTATASDAHVVWVDEPFLAAQGLRPYLDAPLWIPEVHDTVSCAKALGQGLAFRLLEETIGDTAAWHALRPRDLKLRAGLSSERESELLHAWEQSSAAARPVA